MLGTDANSGMNAGRIPGIPNRLEINDICKYQNWKMVLRCNVKGCRSMSSTDKEHSFFRLPKDPETREKWLKFLGPKNCYGSIRICTDHFDNNQIRKKFPRPLLVQNAVPTIKPNEKSPEKSHSQKSVEGKHTESHLPETAKQNRVSPPRTQMDFRITDNHTATHLPEEAEQNRVSPPRTQMEFRITDNHTESHFPETTEQNRVAPPRTQMEFRITDNHTESHLSETTEQGKVSPSRTQIINIHANNIDDILDVAAVSALSTVAVRASALCFSIATEDEQPLLCNASISDNRPSYISDTAPPLDKMPIKYNSTPSRKNIKRQIMTTLETMRLNAQRRMITALFNRIHRLKLGTTK